MKTVLITGVCGGIGRAVARLFRASGWKVVGIDFVEPTELSEVHKYICGDVSSPGFWMDEVLPAFDSADGIDVLVNNAALQVLKPLQDTSVEEWDRVMDTNLKGPFLGLKYLASLLAARKGAVVNVASVHALATSRGIAAYAASKGGLTAFTRAAALDLADMNVRVNAVLPGAVDTEMLEQGLIRSGNAVSEKKIHKLKQVVAEKTPCGRVGCPDEIAKAIFFLSDNDCSAFVTGQSLVVDGGALSRLSTE
jgi:NAD(P)-dependent dehydrogenase (short-subunit alcohol dehydrogenase family)